MLDEGPFQQKFNYRLRLVLFLNGYSTTYYRRTICTNYISLIWGPGTKWSRHPTFTTGQVISSNRFLCDEKLKNLLTR